MRASVCLCLTLATAACPAEDQHVRGNEPIPDCDETGCDDADTFCSGNGKCLDIGTCGVDADCDAVHLCNGTDALCHPGSACGGEQRLVPADVLLVVDRSCSMQNEIEAGVTKWDAALDAIEALVQARGNVLRFGIAFYPDITGDSCGQTDVAFPFAQNAGAAITSLLEDNRAPGDPLYPENPCRTPVAQAMAQAQALLVDQRRQQFAVLISDGRHENCDGDLAVANTTGAINYMHVHGVDTFVIGFDAAADEAALDAYAVAGGRPNPDVAHDFYPATNALALADALLAIADQTLDCAVTLSPPPEDPASIAVFLDEGAPLPPTEWTYDPTFSRLTLAGESCELASAGAIERLDVVYACP